MATIEITAKLAGLCGLYFVPGWLWAFAAAGAFLLMAAGLLLALLVAGIVLAGRCLGPRVEAARRWLDVCCLNYEMRRRCE